MNLLPDWKDILKKAWSIKWIAAAFLFTMIDVVLQMIGAVGGIHGIALALTAGLCSAAAFVARLLAQKNMGDEA